jgi:hypothetical protein
VSVPIEREVSSREDLDVLKRIVAPLLGRTCWKAEVIYGDNLCLHWGDKVASSSKLPEDFEHGSWYLCSGAGTWVVRSPDSLTVVTEYGLAEVNTPERSRTEDTLRKVIENKRTLAIDIEYPSLSAMLTFADGSQVSIESPGREDTLDLPYWELFCPNDVFLRVGPGLEWAYLPSDAVL